MDINSIMYAADSISPGGPSAPAWGFFTALTAGVLTIIGIQLKGRHDARLAKEAAEQAAKNTVSVSNGFAGRMDRKLDGISDQVRDLDKDFRDHLEWHINNPSQKER